eukprot:1893000-Prymnesium_polylepis.1
MWWSQSVRSGIGLHSLDPVSHASVARLYASHGSYVQLCRSATSFVDPTHASAAVLVSCSLAVTGSPWIVCAFLSLIAPTHASEPVSVYETATEFGFRWSLFGGQLVASCWPVASWSLLVGCHMQSLLRLFPLGAPMRMRVRLA